MRMELWQQPLVWADSGFPTRSGVGLAPPTVITATPEGRLAHRSLLCLLGLEEGELGEIKTRAVPGNSVTLSCLNFSCHLRV